MSLRLKREPAHPWRETWNNTLGAHTVVNAEGYVKAMSCHANAAEMRLMAASYEMAELLEGFMDIDVEPERSDEDIVASFLVQCQRVEESLRNMGRDD